MDSIRIIDTHITLAELKKIATNQFGDLVKAVVDIDMGHMAIGGELHADEEAVMIAKGSAQTNLWGVNLYPDKFKSPDFIEYDSMINIRPSQNNQSRNIKSVAIQKQIIKIISELVK